MSDAQVIKNDDHSEDPFPETAHSSDEIRDLFRQGKYPYEHRIGRSVYEAHKSELQVELLKAQNWVKQTGQRIVCLFEGRKDTRVVKGSDPLIVGHPSQVIEKERHLWD
jgi:polyphosphate kinase 2 (PPK2 family)